MTWLGGCTVEALIMKHAAICTCAALLLVALLVVLPHSVFAAELVNFNSASVPPTPFAIKRAKAKGIELKAVPGTPLTGLLSKPKGDGPFPAVVLMHGCAGIRSHHDGTWASDLTRWGYVNLQVDSLGPRGLSSICEATDRAVDQTSDAFGAIRYVRGLSYVDPDRVAIMGWSMGGMAALNAVAKTGTAPLMKERFQIAVALYPICGNFLGDFYAPVFVLIGDKDDWTLATSCVRMKSRSPPGAQPIELKVYPGVYHSFDARAPDQMYLGHQIKYDAEADEDARERVKEFLAKYLQ